MRNQNLSNVNFVKKVFLITDLTKHKLAIHEKSKPFQCELCEKRFSQKPELYYNLNKDLNNKRTGPNKRTG